MYPVTAKGARERRGEMPGREREKGKERGCNGHRGRDVDDRKTKIRNSNLSREQLISRTHLPPSSLRPCPPRCSRLADHPSHCLSTPRWRRKPPPVVVVGYTAHGRRASHVPSSRDSYGNWQADRAFNRRNRMAELERLSKEQRLFPGHPRKSSPSGCSALSGRLCQLAEARYLNYAIDAVPTSVLLVPPQLTRR